MGPQSLAPPLVLTDWGLTQAGQVPSVPASHCLKGGYTRGRSPGRSPRRLPRLEGTFRGCVFQLVNWAVGGPGSPTFAPLRDPCGYQLLGFVEGE